MAEAVNAPELSLEQQKAAEASDFSLDENGIPKNGIISKTMIKEGTEGPKPRYDHEVTVHYVGKLEDGKVFDESRGRGKPMTVVLNRGQLIPGFEAAIQTMRLNETASFLIHATKAYGQAGCGADIPPNSNLIFEIELLSFSEKERELDELNGDELILYAQDKKNDGNLAIKEKKYENAIKSYEDGIKAMSMDAVRMMTDNKVLENALQLNLALANINIENFGAARKACQTVLDNDPKNVKAIYRLSLAYVGLGMLEEAKKDIYKLCREDPKNPEFRATFDEINKKLAEHKAWEKERYGKMFASEKKEAQEEVKEDTEVKAV